jgi:hypothetical protein
VSCKSVVMVLTCIQAYILLFLVMAPVTGALVFLSHRSSLQMPISTSDEATSISRAGRTHGFTCMSYKSVHTRLDIGVAFVDTRAVHC